MPVLEKGRYKVRLVEGLDGLGPALALRASVFPADRAGADAYDAICRHLVVEEGDDVLATCRILSLAGGSEIGRSYSAAYYGLDTFAAHSGPLVEVGRLCIRPGRRDADILRMLWGALTRIVEREEVELLFGCASFQGTDPADHSEALGLLHARHVAPPRWRPRVKAPRTVGLAQAGQTDTDPRRGLAGLPPLLRTYLTMGGWVSDHAVVDPEMGTLHVFTGVEIGAIPPARKRLLRAVAA